MAFIPYMVLLAVFYTPEIIVPLSLIIPLLEAPRFLHGDPAEEAFLSSVTIISSLAVSFILSKARRERDSLRKTLQNLREEAGNIDTLSADIDAGNGFLSQHLSSIRATDDEIREVLNMARQAMSAQSAHVFALRDNTLTLKCSSEGSGQGGIPGREYLSKYIGTMQTATFGAEGSANIVTPIMDGSYRFGLLMINFTGGRSFRDSDTETARMFSSRVISVLQRQRMYSQLQREHLMLRKLKDGGAKLITSLKISDIAGSLFDAAYSIVSLERTSMALFVPGANGFELVRQVGLTIPDGATYDLKNTRIGLAARSVEPDYISDMRSERSAVLPFMKNDQGSVFILPLSYEKELLAIFLLLTPLTNAIHPYQVELLKVLGDQASSSLANAKFHAEIERMAITDGLTGLFNHRNFQERLSTEVRRLRRFSEPLSLLLVDIDFFKKINDNYGHPAGDEILRGVARTIKETIRDVDVPARYGGEEFSAILPGTDSAGASNMAERLRKSIAGKVFSVAGKDLSVTVSIGVVTCSGDLKDKEELVEKADQALYHAKKNGRNRCVLWEEIRSNS